MTAVAKLALTVRFSGFIAILGAVALRSGLGEMTGVNVPGLSLLLIVCGLALIATQLIQPGDTWKGQA